MRRQERAVTSFSSMLSILERCDCCRLAFSDAGSAPYIVPMNFGYQAKGELLVLYFHCASDGKRLQCLQQDPLVGFELDTGHRRLPGPSPCSFSFCYQSIIGQGRLELLTEPAEKAAALTLLLAHYSEAPVVGFPPEALNHVAAMKLSVTEWTCKEHRPPED